MLTDSRPPLPGPPVVRRSVVQSTTSRGVAFFDRHYRLLAIGVLALAAFNLLFRLNQEFVRDWDESLYAITASEVLENGTWIGTTFWGALDYYNTKPPLNVWLIALAFKAFGINLISLRLVSVVSSWLTVAVLVAWTRRSFGSTVSILSGLVLATCFAFFYVHAGRNGNTDALFTLLILLVVVTLHAETTHAWRRAWLGLLLAAVFLLRGMGVLMPLALVVGVILLRRRGSKAFWLPTVMAGVLFAVPVGAWIVARYRLDQWEFLGRLFWYDFVARSTQVIEEHGGGPLFYLNILQKHQYDWLIAGCAALLMFPIPWSRLRAQIRRWNRTGLAVLLAVWAGVALVIPTLMRTKLPWYLHPFYPPFAIAVALLVAHALSQAAAGAHVVRRRALLTIVLLMLGVAESKLIWYSFHYRDLGLSDQGLMLSEAPQLTGTRLYRDRRDTAGDFVIRNMIRAESYAAADLERFLTESRPGDFFLTAQSLSHRDLQLVRSNAHYRLYRRNVSIQESAPTPTASSAPVLTSPVSTNSTPARRSERRGVTRPQRKPHE